MTPNGSGPNPANRLAPEWEQDLIHWTQPLRCPPPGKPVAGHTFPGPRREEISMIETHLGRSVFARLALASIVVATAAHADDTEDRLGRKGFFGAAAAPVTEEVR